MTYREAIDWLYGTQLLGIKLGLENVNRLFGDLGLFEKIDGRRVVHVAGTNGKGSVCAMIDSICRTAGLRSGLFTSPHLVSFRERIRVDGEMMPEDSVAAGLSRIRSRVGDREPHPTFFEITTALAVEHFCESDCEVLVMETGMGGRLDATNILPANVSVITPIGLDHQQWLGESLAEIAGEKAGIFKADVPAVSARQEPEAEAVLRRVAESAGAPLAFVSGEIRGDWPVGLTGRHQRANAALALAAIEALGADIGDAAIRAGLAAVSWPGRFQRVGGRIVIDGAHNESAVAALVETWKQEFGDEKATLVFGGVSSKDTAAILSRLSEIASGIVFVPVHSQRGLTSGELELIWRDLPAAEFTAAHSAASLSEAFEESAGRILVAGSLFLAGEALSVLESRGEFEISEQ